uniref:Rab-GAP TBC domain-containing protein n=1 Tax=Oryctolagus cuniculus TaxID=9986 RepID=A0A5F9DM29_RABIT
MWWSSECCPCVQSVYTVVSFLPLCWSPVLNGPWCESVSGHGFKTRCRVSWYQVGREAGSESPRDAGAGSRPGSPVDLGPLEDTWLPAWGRSVLSKGRGGKVGAVLPQPSLVPELCTSHNPGTRPPGARLPGCVAAPPLTRGTALKAAFLCAPQCWLSCACVSYRLDMNALRSRKAQERAELINKYEQGCRGAALLEPEEEDDEGGCLVPDRLGFLHEQKLPQDSTPGAKRKQEVRRIQKWIKMIKNHSKYRGSDKFQRRIYKGIPAQVRGKVWAVMLEVDKRKAQNAGKYAEMKELARLGATHFHHIDSAIAWTFRNHLMFRERYGMNQQALFHILMAYSVYNPEVGYSQGLSHVVALLLMYMPEEDAFWALVQLMESRKHAMHGFYKPNTPKLERFQQHLGLIVHRVLPSLEKHLEKEGVCLEDSTAHWYIDCFLDGVSARGDPCP